jgi:hypothetical protein
VLSAPAAAHAFCGFYVGKADANLWNDAIVILSAEQSDGLETWLLQNGYRIPRGASRALAPYIA